MEKLQKKDNRLVREFKNTLFQLGVSPGDRILVGVSGGPDSVCLLQLLKSVSEIHPLDLSVAHLEHGLRGEEAVQDARFVADLARRWKIPALVESVDVRNLARRKKISLQVAAREARYDFFARVADKTQSRWVALGHTADDQAETFLIRLLRGAGGRGLAAIPPAREISRPGSSRLTIIRPLLGISRKRVLEYLREERVAYRQDSSNAKPEYLRNRIRQEVLDKLTKTYNPKLVEKLGQTAGLLLEVEDFFKIQFARVLPELGVEPNESGISLRRDKLMSLHPALRRFALRELLSRVRGDLTGISFGHVEDSLCLIESGGTGKYLVLPGGVSVRIHYDRFRIGRDTSPSMEQAVLPVPGEVLLAQAGIRVRASQWSGPVTQDPKRRGVFDPSRFQAPLVIRRWWPGDSFFPAGMGGKRKKLQDFFVDLKIPRQERYRIPILTAGEGILWVMGLRFDGRFLAGPEAGMTVAVEMDKA